MKRHYLGNALSLVARIGSCLHKRCMCDIEFKTHILNGSSPNFTRSEAPLDGNEHLHQYIRLFLTHRKFESSIHRVGRTQVFQENIRTFGKRSVLYLEIVILIIIPKTTEK